MVLIYKRCKKDEHVGLTPILIALAMIINSASTFLLIWFVDPFYFAPTEQDTSFAIFFCIQQSSFFFALWLFGAMVLEIALEIESVILHDHQAVADKVNEDSAKRLKRNLSFAKHGLTVLVLVFHLPLIPTYMESGLSDKAHQGLVILGFAGQGTFVVLTSLVMTLTLWKLRLIADQTQEKDLNPWLAFLWFFSTFCWAGTWFAIVITSIISGHGSYGNEYPHMNQLAILSFITHDSLAITVSIMAVILYRSSKVKWKKLSSSKDAQNSPF